MATKTTGTNNASDDQHDLNMAFAAATYVDDKKAENVVIMDVRGISPVTDYFVICTVTSMPQLRAVSNELKDRFWLEHQRKPIACDERFDSLWVIQHYGDVMIHIFHQEKREFYSLEELWGDAPRIPWESKSGIVQLDAEKKPAAKKAAKKAVAKKAAVKKVAKKAAAKKTTRKKAE